MARKNYTKNYINTHVSTLNDHTGEITEITRITTNMNYTGSFSLDINYLSTIKFMLLFSMIILYAKAVLNRFLHSFVTVSERNAMVFRNGAALTLQTKVIYPMKFCSIITVTT